MDDLVNLRFEETLGTARGRYSILQLLGLGGSAETYLVLATSGDYRGQLFAARVFRRVSRPEWRSDFLSEAAFLQSCSHPAIMRIFDQGLYGDERPFVIAEYLPRTLARALVESPTMPEKLSYAVQLLSALQYLTKIGVVHRDVKPENIFIKGGACVLGDFGLMKRVTAPSDAVADREMVKQSVGPGMPRDYRVPDLVAYLAGGPPPTVASDVFQLGLVFARMFTGENPARPLAPGEDFTTPVQLDPLKPIPGGMRTLIETALVPMLEFDREKRPTASFLLGQWQALFLEAASRAHALEGRVL